MTTVAVRFRYITGIAQHLFAGAALVGSWDVGGRTARTWTRHPMTRTRGADGCPAFTAVVQFAPPSLLRELNRPVLLWLLTAKI